MGVKYQLRAATLIPLILISIIFAVCYNWQFNQYLEKEITGVGDTFIRQLMPASEYALLNNDRRTLQGLINATLTNSSIKSIAFYNQKKQLIASRGQASQPAPKLDKYIKRLQHKQVNLSTVRFMAPVIVPAVNVYQKNQLIVNHLKPINTLAIYPSISTPKAIPSNSIA